MPDHLVFSQHMKGADFDAKVRNTFLGQEHFAGSGPEGKTCRECVKWHKTGKKLEPGYHRDNDPVAPRELKRAKCNHQIANKANRLIPHGAGACRFFVQADNPWPIINPVEPKEKKPKAPKRKKKK